MRQILFYYLLFIAGISCVNAQHIQFSQIEVNQILYHPASFVLENTNAQASAVYRTQSINGISFRNMLIAYRNKINDFMIGAKIVQNDAGATSIKTTKFLLDFNYQKRLNESGDILAFGISGGLRQQRFEPETFQFGSQYIEGEGFDPGILNGETFVETNQSIPILNVSLSGIKYFNAVKTTIGIAMNNVNKPAMGFYTNSLEYLPVTFFAFMSASMPLGNKKTTSASAYLMYNQLLVNAEYLLGLKVNHSFLKSYSVNIGLMNRLENSWVITTGIAVQRFSIDLSYDVNCPLNNEVEKIKGALELNTKYNF